MQLQYPTLNRLCKYKMGRNRLGNSSAKKDVGVTVNDKPSMSQQRHIVVKMASVIPRYRNRHKAFETWIGASILLGTGKNTAGLEHCTPGKAWARRKEFRGEETLKELGYSAESKE